MIHLPASVRVYLCLSPCDMRRSFDGLHALVRDHLKLDAFAGHLTCSPTDEKTGSKSSIGNRSGFVLGETFGGRRLRHSLRRGRLGSF